jgi:hypothetical protein
VRTDASIASITRRSATPSTPEGSGLAVRAHAARERLALGGDLVALLEPTRPRYAFALDLEDQVGGDLERLSEAENPSVPTTV